MKLHKRKALVVCVAFVLIAASTLFAFRTITAYMHTRLSQASGISDITEYTVPGDDPWGTAFDSSGRVWIAMPGCDFAPTCRSSTPPGELALFDPKTQSWTTVVSLPAGYGQPIFVAVDHNGKVWFTMPATNTIGMYNPGNATFAQWVVPSPDAGPWDVVIDSKDKIWFTECYGNKIGSFDPASQTFQEITTPASKSEPYGITVDASDNIWFTENSDMIALIGEYTKQGALQEYKIRNTPTAGLTPHMITTDAHGHIWWSEGWAGAIGMLDVATAQPGTNQGVTEYHYTTSCKGCGSHTSGISIDRQGLIWFDDSLQDIFGSFRVVGSSFSFFATKGHPHDGLNVDAQNRIWYSEESSNKLAVATEVSNASISA